MRISRQVGFLAFWILLIVWLACLMLAPEDYKISEAYLVFVYIITFALVINRTSVYEEMAIFLAIFGLYLCSLPVFDLLDIKDIHTTVYPVQFDFNDFTIITTVNAIAITLLAILLAFLLWGDFSLSSYEREDDTSRCMGNSVVFSDWFYVLYWFTFLVVLFVRYEQVSSFFSAGGLYLNVFKGNVVDGFARYFFFSVIVFDYLFYLFLSSHPQSKDFKKYATLYVITLLPLLAMGRRGHVFPQLVFLVWYYHTYIGKINLRSGLGMGTVLVLLADFVVFFRGHRSDAFISEFGTNVLILIRHFVEQQGWSIHVINFSVAYYDELKHMELPNVPYFLAQIFMYFQHLWCRLTLQESVLGHGQTIAAMESNSYLGWNLPYLVNPSLYLAGGGTGSCFVAEYFLFFGYIGCFFLTILMMYFIFAVKRCICKKHSIFARFLYYLILRDLFLCPRSSFLQTISSVFPAVIMFFMMRILWPRFIKKRAVNGESY